MRAIDVHCHPSTREHHLAMGTYMAALERMLGRTLTPKSEEEMANDFRRDDVLAMMIASDAQHENAAPIISNDFIAGLTERHPDVFLPGWAVVDPWKGKAAVVELERAFTKLHLAGAKWMPIL